MKKLLFLLLIPCFSWGATTYTTRAGIPKPGDGDTDWGTTYRAAMDVIDSSFSVLSATETHAEMTITSGTVNTLRSNAIIVIPPGYLTSSSATITTINGSTIAYSSATLTNASISLSTITALFVSTITPTGIAGTRTNNDALAGNYGEIISTISVINVNAATSTQFDDLLSITLTAGDWDVSALLYCDSSGSTWTLASFFIGTTAGNNSTGLQSGNNYAVGQWASSSTTPLLLSLNVPSFRMSLSATTTVYLKRSFTFSIGTPRSSGGRISARRVR